jgi:lipoprotein-anchoring transpeptidase ErfK/SrfK
MRPRLLLLGFTLLAACLATTAQAVMRTDYDPVLKKWISYDTKSDNFFYGGGASSIPREMVNYDGPYGPHTIVINTDERRLYYIYEKGKAIKYGIGVGREGFQWSGTDVVSSKAEWPGWTPPPEMIVRERAKGRILPNFMAGGLDNPLGARALYIGARIYRIHGSNEPWSIGHAVSSGCIRLTNQDIIDLYDRVPVGTRVVVLLSTQPQTEDAVATNGSEEKPPLPKPPAKVLMQAREPAAPVVAERAALKLPDAPKAVEKPVVAKLPPKPVEDSPPPAVEAKAAVEQPVVEAKVPDKPAIEVKASLSASASGGPSVSAEARASIELKKLVPDAAPHVDQPAAAPVAPAPAAPAPAASAPAGDDTSGAGRS